MVDSYVIVTVSNVMMTVLYVMITVSLFHCFTVSNVLTVPRVNELVVMLSTFKT